MNSNTKNILLLTAGVLFLALFIGHPFLHNHEADMHDHHDCPAFQIQTSLVLYTICFYLIFLFLLWLSVRITIYDIPFKTSFLQTSTLERAPPL
jgi:hypothetical protein